MFHKSSDSSCGGVQEKSLKYYEKLNINNKNASGTNSNNNE